MSPWNKLWLTAYKTVCVCIWWVCEWRAAAVKTVLFLMAGCEHWTVNGCSALHCTGFTLVSFTSLLHSHLGCRDYLFTQLIIHCVPLTNNIHHYCFWVLLFVAQKWWNKPCMLSEMRYPSPSSRITPRLFSSASTSSPTSPNSPCAHLDLLHFVLWSRSGTYCLLQGLPLYWSLSVIPHFKVDLDKGVWQMRKT